MVVAHGKRGPLSGCRMEAAKAFLVANGVTKEELEKEDYVYAPVAIRISVRMWRQSSGDKSGHV